MNSNRRLLFIVLFSVLLGKAFTAQDDVPIPISEEEAIPSDTRQIITSPTLEDSILTKSVTDSLSAGQAGDSTKLRQIPGVFIEERLDKTPYLPDELYQDMVYIKPSVIPPIGNVKKRVMRLGEDKELYSQGFYIDRTEVTNRQFAMFLSAADSPAVYHDPRMDIVPSEDLGYHAVVGREDYPVVYVDWYAAMAFAKWAGKELPTEEEWLLAAVSTGSSIDTEAVFPWGSPSVDSTRGNFLTTKRIPKPCSTGSFPFGATPLSIFDMAGNVAEWTISDSLYHFQNDDWRRLFVIKGGSFLDPGINLRLDQRALRSPEERLQSIGFRCIKRVTENEN